MKANLKHLGGCWWSCTACGQTFREACSCCEPFHRCAPKTSLQQEVNAFIREHVVVVVVGRKP